MTKKLLESETATSIEQRMLPMVACLREQFMWYYKDHCEDPAYRPREHNLSFVELPIPDVRGRRRFNYERDEHRAASPKRVEYLGAPLFRMSKRPHEIYMYQDVLQRSPEMRFVQQSIHKFFSRYLPSVKIKTDNATRPNWLDGSSDSEIGVKQKSEMPDIPSLVAEREAKEQEMIRMSANMRANISGRGYIVSPELMAAYETMFTTAEFDSVDYINSSMWRL